MGMSRMSTSPIHQSLMDLLAFPMLSSELELSEPQRTDLERRAFEVATLAGEVNVLGAELSLGAPVSAVSNYLTRRAKVLTTLYESSLQARAALSETQLRAYQEMEAMRREQATMRSSGHAAMMQLVLEAGHAGMVKTMTGPMGSMPEMDHQNGTEKTRQHKL